MKVCVLGDTHFGAKMDSIQFHDHFELFYKNIFFPYIDENDIKVVFQLGDLFDRRKTVNLLTLHRSKEYFFEEIRKRPDVKFYCLVGNHDTYHKNTNRINSPELLLKEYENFIVINDPSEIVIDEIPLAIIPWICQDNELEISRFIENTKAQILMGHLELKGFQMYRGSVNLHGHDSNMFKKFDMVLSGHFHHRSSKGNIHYVGTPYEITWSDADDPRGFHILDLETRDLTFIRNPYIMHKKILYDGGEVDEMPFVSGLYVKVFVKSKTDQKHFDNFILQLESQNPYELNVLEDKVSLLSDSKVILETKDTTSIIETVVSDIEVNKVDKEELKSVLVSLYNDALRIS